MTTRRSVLTLTALSLLLTASIATAGYEEGMAAFKARNFEQAVAEFQQFVEERPDQHAGYQMLGLSLLSARRPAEAVAPLEKALELKGENPADRLYLGRALHLSGKHRDAISTLSRLNIGSLPAKNQSQVYQMRSASYARLGNTGSAAADLGRVADLNPSDAAARFEYGQMLHSDAQLDPAIAAYERAVSMDGSNSEWKTTLVNALKVKGRSTSGSAKSGIYRKAEDYARSLVGTSASYDNLLLLGEVQLGGKNYESAASTLQQAISKRRNDWHAHLYLGQAYGSLERYNDAEAPLNDALGLASGEAEKQVLDYLGFVLEKQRKFEASITAYERAGNAGGAARVRENQQIQQENQEADQFNANIAELERQREELRRQLEEVPGATNEPPRQ
ncbi:MAG: tetratricopeptide repeat protein [Acidobacteriota bacterium]|nr:tetratricopeptide repeat protein [Acidobacteriota bacterium]MDE2922813.1 tetratricopeptide repeat protein [Acidobacteriota bacterium]MDE3263369.1 tetratricopeptide repeat protein [Acidobacteriota bacterium]